MVTLLISILNIVIFVALFGCLAGWGQAAVRWQRGQPLLAPERRRRPRHGIAEVVMLIGLWLVLTVFGIGVAERFGWVEPLDRDAASTLQLDPDFAIRFTIEGLAKLAAIGLLLGWLRTIQPHAAARLGLVPRRADLRIGLVAAAMLIPPVMIVQQVLNQLIPYMHPVKDLIEARPTPLLGTLLALNTVLIAPLAEEFFFRGVLQGWFQRLAASRFRGRAADETSAGETSVGETDPTGEQLAAGEGATEGAGRLRERQAASDWLEADEVQRLPRWPMVLTSLLFSLVHWGQGAAPVSLFLLAIGLSYLTRQTGRLGPAITVHFCLNATATAAMFLAAGSPTETPPLGP